MSKKKLLIISIFLVASILVLNYKTNLASNIDSPLPNIDLSKLEKANNLKYQPKKMQGGGQEFDLQITAQSAIVVDAQTGNILFEKNANEKMAPASVAKILTALVASEKMDINSRINVSEKTADMEPNKIVLTPGEKIRLEDLLYGLMMVSANDAAEVIAENYPGGRKAFVNALNKKVQNLGLKDTQYKNPSGLDEEGFYATVYDMATIVNYCIHNKPEILKYAGTTNYIIPATEGINNGHPFSHISQLLNAYPYMIASKPGFTDNAGNTLLGVAEKNGKKIIMVYFNSSDGMNDGRNLFEYGFSKIGV